MLDSDLIQHLRDPALYEEDAGSDIEQWTLIETHISWVILTKHFAFKIKKPVSLGFLDFSTLEKRKFFCEEELRLNRRLAPDWYLAVVPIYGSPHRPTFKPVQQGGSEAIEYAVKMRRFADQQRLDRVLAAGGLKQEHMVDLADSIASFHQSLTPVSNAGDHGSVRQVTTAVVANFAAIEAALGAIKAPHSHDLVATLQCLMRDMQPIERWSVAAGRRLEDFISKRRQGGFIRECHGDLHLQNLFLPGDGRNSSDGVTAFDCIEFDPELRWIDVVSEISFLIMDLESRGASALAWTFLNAYLERSGDYAGMKGLRYYRVYRAMVRAKVAAIRCGQAATLADIGRTSADCQAHLALAQAYVSEEARSKPLLITTIGLSGSGKSRLTGQLMAALPALRLRSDVERKRLFERSPETGFQKGLYAPQISARLYQQLAATAAGLLNAGYVVIVDATFLDRERRQQFPRWVGERLTGTRVKWVQLYCDPPLAVLRERVKRRSIQGLGMQKRSAGNPSDADLDILEQQLARSQLPGEDESFIRVDTSKAIDVASLCKQLATAADANSFAVDIIGHGPV